MLNVLQFLDIEEVVLVADLLQVVVWLTPAGTLDDGGVKQPAYLNFEVSLLGPPAGNEMKVGSLCKTNLRRRLTSFCSSSPCAHTRRDKSC